MPQDLNVQNQAIGQMVDLVATRVGTDRAVHAETAIASAARLSGSLMFRSFDLEVGEAKPGTAVLSAEANESFPQLIELTWQTLSSFGVSIERAQASAEPDQRGEPPTLNVVQSLSLLQDGALTIAKRHGLELADAAQLMAIATAFLIKESDQDIGAQVGFNVALYGFIEGCKTVPPPLGVGLQGAPQRPANAEPKQPARTRRAVPLILLVVVVVTIAVILLVSVP